MILWNTVMILCHLVTLLFFALIFCSFLKSGTRNQVREILFQKSGSANSDFFFLVREKWLTRKKNPSLKNHFSRTIFLHFSSSCRLNGCFPVWIKTWRSNVKFSKSNTCKIIKLMIGSDGNKKILWIILILTTFSFFKSAAQHTVGRVVYFLKPICYLWFVEICIRRKWACSPSLATTNNSPSLETDIRRIFSCRLCQAQYSQSVFKIDTSSLFSSHMRTFNNYADRILPFFDPPPFLSGQFLYPARGQKKTFFDPSCLSSCPQVKGR